MTILALYVPKPEELTHSVTLVLFAFVVLCICAYFLRLPVPLAAALMVVGGTIFVVPDILAILRDPHLAQAGEHARAVNISNHSDAFFGVTGYLYVGRGQLMALAGMSVAFFGLIAFKAILNRSQTHQAGSS